MCNLLLEKFRVGMITANLMSVLFFQSAFSTHCTVGHQARIQDDGIDKKGLGNKRHQDSS